MTQKQIYFTFGAILLIAILLRFWQLGSVPYSLYWDEAAMLLDAKVVAVTGQDMHGNWWLQALFPSYGDFKLPVYIWFTSVAVQLFGVTNLTVRLPSALAGMGSICLSAVIAYKLARTTKHSVVLSRVTALASAAVMTLSPWSILFSRTGFEGHLAQFLLSASIASTLYLKHPLVRGAVAAILGAVAVYTYFSVRFVWPAVFLGTLLLLALESRLGWKAWLREQGRRQLLTAAVGLGLFFLLMVPMVRSPLYEASNTFRLSTDSVLKNETEVIQSNVYRELAGDTIFDRFTLHRSLLTIRELAHNYADHLSLTYLFLTGDPNLRHGTGMHGLYLFPFIIALPAGLYWLARRSLPTLLFLIGWWLIGLLPAAVPETTPHALRSLNALMPSTLILGFGILQLWQVWQAGAVRSLKRLGLVLWGLAVMVSAVFFVYDYFVVYPDRAYAAWQGGYETLAEAMVAHKDGVKEVWLFTSDVRVYLWVLLQPHFSPNEIQALPKENYELKKIENIVLNHHYLPQLLIERERYFLVSTPENAIYIRDVLPPETLREEVVTSPAGEPVYILLYFEPIP